MLEKVKLLIRPEAIRNKMVGYKLPTTLDDARAKLAGWADRLKNRTLDKKKETELLPKFLSDIFGGLLGYREVVSEAKTADYSLKRETLVVVEPIIVDVPMLIPGDWWNGAWWRSLPPEDVQLIQDTAPPRMPPG